MRGLKEKLVDALGSFEGFPAHAGVEGLLDALPAMRSRFPRACGG